MSLQDFVHASASPALNDFMFCICDARGVSVSRVYRSNAFPILMLTFDTTTGDVQLPPWSFVICIADRQLTR